MTLAAATLYAHGQTPKDSVQLAEVTVKGTRVVHKDDMTLFYPDDQQKAASTNGYNLLARTALPGIRIDEVGHTITALGDRGNIQLRLNGLICGKAELLTLDPKTVKRIEFIDNPGVRYGNDIGYVLNIITIRSDAGYRIGLDNGNAITALSGDNSAFVRLNHGISEWGALYDFNYKDYKKTLNNNTSVYLQPDGTTRTISRNDLDGRQKEVNQSLQLFYNAVKADQYIFQAKLDGSLQRTPDHYRHILVKEKESNYKATEKNTERITSPVLDLYLQTFFGKEQTLTVNAVGTYIHTKGYSSYDEETPYAYNTNGKSYSLMSEAIYEYQLRPFKMTSGIQYNQKFTNNQYTGDTEAHDLMHRSTVYLFGQLSGKWGALRYTGGLGYSFLRFSQGDNRYHFNLFRPKLSLNYSLSKSLSLSYSFEISQHVSQIAMTNNVSIRQNSLEWKVGNPDVRPNQFTEQLLRLSYNRPHFSTTLEGFYRINRHANLDHYSRQTDAEGNTYYIYTQTNQKGCDMFIISDYIRLELIPDKLSFNGQAGLCRFMNRGDDYSHYYTAFNGSLSLTAYLGALTLSAYADNGWNFMEGEHRGHTGAATYLSASYRMGDLTLSAYWQYPFQRNPRTDKTEILNRYVRKTDSTSSQDLGNIVSIGLTWSLNKGRHYKDIERQMNYKDKENGILK